MKQFDAITLGALDIAYSRALEGKNTEVYPEHLVFGLVKNPQTFFSRTFSKEVKNIEKIISELPVTTNSISIEQLKVSPKLSEWITLASSFSVQGGRSEIKESDLVRFLPKILPHLDLDFSRLNNEENEEDEMPSFLIDLGELAREGKLDPVIGRSREIRALMEILGRRNKNNPCLVGNAGVGKTAIVEGLANAIAKGDVPDMLQGKTVYSLDLGSLMAGTKFRGEFEERIQKLLKFIKSRASESILFVDEIHQLIGAGKTEGAMDAANLLKPALARGELHCIGATTQDEFQKYIMKDPALERRFRSVPVLEPSKEDAVEILMGIREKLEIHHGIKISDEAIFSAVNLSIQYITDKYLPDKAIDLIDEASSAMKLSAEALPADIAELGALIRTKKINAQIHKNDLNLEQEIESLEKEFSQKKLAWEKEVFAVKRVSELKSQLDKAKHELELAQRNQHYEKAGELMYSVIPDLEKELVGNAHDWILQTEHVAGVISRQTGIPSEKILKNKQEEILGIENFLNTRVYGQLEPIHEISETLIAAHAGLTEITRPLGSFLLLGPSGVGKTESAKGIADFLFNDESQIIRIDMSEYSEKHSVSKLIGAAPGYIGYEEGGVLTEAVRRRPYSVILFDEIEKAHPDFSDILLQILDDGRLTDNRGRTVSFRNTIVMLTSNVKNHEAFFKPEVLGRLDGILHYQTLGAEVGKRIIEKELKFLNERLKDKSIHLNLDETLYSALERQGLSDKFGARPLKSAFNRLVIRPLSKSLLKGENFEGPLMATYKDNQVRFQTL